MILLTYNKRSQYCQQESFRRYAPDSSIEEYKQKMDVRKNINIWNTTAFERSGYADPTRDFSSFLDKRVKVYISALTEFDEMKSEIYDRFIRHENQTTTTPISLIDPHEVVHKHTRQQKIERWLKLSVDLETSVANSAEFVTCSHILSHALKHPTPKQTWQSVRNSRFMHSVEFVKDCHLQINTATNWKEIVNVIKLFGLNSVADRIIYLHKLIAENPDETAFNLESLRKLALFLTTWLQLPEPQISVSPEGFAHIEWQIPNRSILFMVFLPSGRIRYTAIIQSHQSKFEPWDMLGTLPPEQMMDVIGPFIDTLTTS